MRSVWVTKSESLFFTFFIKGLWAASIIILEAWSSKSTILSPASVEETSVPSNKIKSPAVILYGEDEIKSGKPTLRNLITGKEKSIEIKELINEIKKII